MAEQSARVKAVARSGLFDAVFYVRFNDVSAVEPRDALAHYCEVGEALGCRPNLLFDPHWYRTAYRIEPAGTLLAHYADAGERAGEAPSPLFDPGWYRAQQGLRDGEGALAHYLAHRDAGTVSPNPYFDVAFYAEGSPDTLSADTDPFEHYVRWGVFEGRRPSAGFDPHYVWQRYLNGDRSKNPFVLFLQYGPTLGWTGVPDPEEPTVAGEIGRFTMPGPDFEERPAPAGGLRRAKALAFYLPQFHAIPQNDRWWGAGFTEWRNVPRGVPRFKDHFQPRVPRDLGFYTLEGTDLIRRQVSLARAAGLHGFCFYYYNFNGERLLEAPLDAFLADTAIAFPFCLLWANENWTRRWDGRNDEVLIRQDYRPEQAPALVADLARYMDDARYIRIGGRPLLFFYRVDVIPDTVRTLQRWRALFAAEHGLEPLFVMAQTFGNNDPRPFGFDGAVEFPPHKFASFVPKVTGEMRVLEAGYDGDVRRYDDVVSASLADSPADYPLIKTVFPGWDNDARRPGRGMVVHGATPAKFQAWIEALLPKIEQRPAFGERFVCVNAWNEWCEGAYLEPDVHYGYAYLNALARGLSQVRQGSRRKILLVGHDAFPAGTQQLLLNVGIVLRFRFGLDVAFVLLGEGALLPRYEAVAPTFAVDLRTRFWPALVAHLHALRQEGYAAALVNSAMAGHVMPPLVDLGFATVALVHELPTLLSRNEGAERLELVLSRADHVVFPARAVREAIVARFGAPAKTTSILPQGLYKDVGERDPDEVTRIRQSLRVPPDAALVLNAGYADLRKGVDRFVAIARLVAATAPRIVFAWVGDADPAVETWLLDPVRADPASNIRIVPFTDGIAGYLHAADLLLLTSREDPFPSVVLEALSAGLPVLAFQSGGGYVDLLRQTGLGTLLPSDDLAEAAAAVVRLAADRAARAPEHARHRAAHIAEHHDFGRYCFEVLRRATPAHAVSVIVPNFNYARYLEGRLASVFNQTYPVFEIIVLDDGSTDGSLDEIERVSHAFARELTLVEGAGSQGLVSAQWRKGVARARGDLVWIAEADDLAEAGFLEGLSLFFDRSETAFAFSDSSVIDAEGVARGQSYKRYYETLFPGALASTAVFEGRTFAQRYLSVKNVILNASAVLWRRNTLARVLDECAADLGRFRMAGDWLLYAQACRHGWVGYNAAPLNVHRRHDESVTATLDRAAHLDEVERMHERMARQEPSNELADRQAAYRQEIGRQFAGVAPLQPHGLEEDLDGRPAATPPRSRA